MEDEVVVSSLRLQYPSFSCIHEFSLHLLSLILTPCSQWPPHISLVSSLHLHPYPSRNWTLFRTWRWSRDQFRILYKRFWPDTNPYPNHPLENGSGYHMVSSWIWPICNPGLVPLVQLLVLTIPWFWSNRTMKVPVLVKPGLSSRSDLVTKTLVQPTAIGWVSFKSVWVQI